MKKAFAALFAALILLTGCEAGEVQRRIVVHALGIDPAGEGYTVSYQIFTGGGGADSGPVDANEQTVITLEADGATLYDAEKNLGLETGREVFLGDVELIVVSRELAGTKLFDLLQYVGRTDIYPGVNVIYCNGRAKDVIGEKLERGAATALLLRGIVQSAVSSCTACSSRIIELSNTVLSDGGARAVPVLTLEKEGDPGEDSSVSPVKIGVYESLVISREGVAGSLSDGGVTGLRLLSCDASDIDAELDTPFGPASVNITGIRAKRRISIEDGRPALRVYIAGKYKVKSAPAKISEEELKILCEKELLRLCGAACRESAESGADFIGLGKLLRKYEPGYYSLNSGDLGGAVKTAVFYVRACLRKY